MLYHGGEAAAVAESPSTPAGTGGETMEHSYREATLAGHKGEGFLQERTDDSGTTVLEGRWRAEDDAAEAYADLRERYLAREPLTFRAADGTERDVYIASWFGMGHPASLIVRSTNALE